MATCNDCSGSGFLYVAEGYADSVLAKFTPPYPQPDNAHQQAINRAAEREYDERRSALLNSVYPCPECSPVQFLAWREGRWPYRADDPNRPARGANVSPRQTRLADYDERLPYRDRD